MQLAINDDQARFRELAELALSYARSLGASDAAAEVAESAGFSVTVRDGDLETLEQNRDRSLDLVVYFGHRRGSASTSDFSPEAIRQAVDAAWHIARYTAEDPVAGLPDTDTLAFSYPSLGLHTPWSITPDEATNLALQTEAAAFSLGPEITNSEGATVSTLEGHFVLANSKGFVGGYPYSRHMFSVAPIAGSGLNMQRDYWYSANRDPNRLADPEAVGRYAAERALARLSARRIKTGRFPVLFEAPLALGLLNAFVHAASGGALYRRASFLLDRLNTLVMAPHLTLAEDPHIIGAMGSSPFDEEGVITAARNVVSDGVLEGYFLSSYTGRKLGLPTTGNAGGSHNLQLLSTQTTPADTFEAMLKKMGTGLLVTELIGQGVNYVTGDYSRGALGYWVENGEIHHAVDEITIAGNLADMLLSIVAVGADTITRGSKTAGSVLIEEMAIAGL